jgi:hypothetical protein
MFLLNGLEVLQPFTSEGFLGVFLILASAAFLSAFENLNPAAARRDGDEAAVMLTLRQSPQSAGLTNLESHLLPWRSVWLWDCRAAQLDKSMRPASPLRRD